MSNSQELLARIRDLESELDKKRRTIDEITGIVNQLNNLLAVMKGHAQLAYEDQNVDARDELVRIVLASTSRAQQLIKNTLAGGAPSDRVVQPAADTAPKTSASILVVDDERLMSELLYRILTKQGHSVAVANSGAEALKICKEQAFDIIFMDIMLGDMNGLDVFREIRDMPALPHVVFFSGDPSIKDVQRMVRQEGADGFIRKPFDINEISGVVQYILNMRSTMTANKASSPAE